MGKAGKLRKKQRILHDSENLLISDLSGTKCGNLGYILSEDNINCTINKLNRLSDNIQLFNSNVENKP